MKDRIVERAYYQTKKGHSQKAVMAEEAPVPFPGFAPIDQLSLDRVATVEVLRAELERAAAECLPTFNQWKIDISPRPKPSRSQHMRR